MHVDRGYIASPVVGEVLVDSGDVICKRVWTIIID